MAPSLEWCRSAAKRLALAVALSTSVACSASDDVPNPAPRTTPEGEAALRKALGVPPDAKVVLVFAQNAHLDIDWQKTFDDYYASFVGDVLVESRKLLESQPRASYSIAEMAYLEHHLEVHPEEKAPLVAAAARGALRVVGGGMTSPDTLLPETELLLRDYLHGIAYSEDTLGIRPTAAWLPDSFGHGATAPDVLAAAGFESVAFSRVDGAPTLFETIFHRDQPPKPGSTAEVLSAVGSADFVWTGSGGASVLAHYMPTFGLYCAGDNIDFDENLQVPGGHIGPFKGDDPKFTDRRIDEYATALAPYAQTPYRFVPVGCDFAHPKPRLLEYLDGYDQRRYPETGVWAVAAPFDDYAKLVSYWRDALPVVAGELSPYYMGFYGSRAGVKRRARDSARPFFVAEAFASALGPDGKAIVQKAAPALKKLTRANHHDFITGTANDAVVAGEQLPLFDEAEKVGDAEVADVAAAIASRIPAASGAIGRALVLNASSATRSDVAELTLPTSGGTVPEVRALVSGAEIPLEVVGSPKGSDATATFRLGLADVPPFSWRAVDLVAGAPSALASQVSLALLDANGAAATGAAVSRIVLTNAHVRAEWERGAVAFALTSLVLDGEEAIARPSVLFRDYQDDGGLWRLGHEMNGCSFSPIATAGDGETVKVVEQTPLVVRVAFESPSGSREASLVAGGTGLSLTVTTSAAEATTRTVSFSFAVDADAALVTSLPAGSAPRALERVYSPTFYPAVAWASVGGVAVLLRQSTGVRMSAPGEVELMAVRDARGEKCDAEGGEGSDPGPHVIEWRIERAVDATAAERAAQAFARPLDARVVGAGQGPALDLPAELSLVEIEGDGVVTALKPAERGEGIVLRALLGSGGAKVVLAPRLGLATAVRIDVAEHDLGPAEPLASPLLLDRSTYGAIASVRLR